MEPIRETLHFFQRFSPTFPDSQHAAGVTFRALIPITRDVRKNGLRATAPPRHPRAICRSLSVTKLCCGIGTLHSISALKCDTVIPLPRTALKRRKSEQRAEAKKRFGLRQGFRSSHLYLIPVVVSHFAARAGLGGRPCRPWTFAAKTRV